MIVGPGQHPSQLDQLEDVLQPLQRWVVLSGAGISAGSGIPTYRDDTGQWLRSDPIQHQDFVKHTSSRQRYWARSMAGWPAVEQAQCNAAHRALVLFEHAGIVPLLVTQNVDRLHQAAGHQAVVDLHGRLDRVCCLQCDAVVSRVDLQRELHQLNPGFQAGMTEVRPDGDADIGDALVSRFTVPACATCGGTLMPDVVFFGGSVPRQKVEHVRQAIAGTDALIIVGSSLKVFSGYRFCREAVAQGKHLVIINRGITRADDIASLKVTADCAPVLEELARRLCKPHNHGQPPNG